MRASFRIPFRFKILATVLVLVTAAVSIITFTMARMFHTDKSAYVSDLAALMAVHAADEAGVVLGNQRGRLSELARLIDDPDIPASRKRMLLSEALTASAGCLAVRVFEQGREIGSFADTLSQENALLVKAALAAPLVQRAHDLQPGAVVAVGLESPDPLRPLLVLLVGGAGTVSRRSMVLAAVLDADRAFSMGRGSSAFDRFLADEAGQVLWHTDPAKRIRHPRIPVVSGVQPGSRAVVREYDLGGIEMLGGVATVRIGGLLAGAQIPKAAAMFASRQLLRDLIWVALLLLLGAALVSLVWSTRLTHSLSRLAGAARQIGRGEFDLKLSVRSRDEMGDLAGSFNQMAMELNAREHALREAQSQLVQSEKMAAFGQLGAGIAHEVKNPLAGIQGIVQLTLRSLEADHPILPQLEMIEKETKRCRAIIDNLLRFARQETTLREPTSLADVVNDTATLMQHQMGLHQVELRTEVAPSLPLVHANANQLQQVLMNLLINAEQAMESRGHGTVTVSASPAGDGYVELRVHDDGPGIPEEIRLRVFEPFFTTKAAGKGTGLGLSVTFGIVRDHGGRIDVASEVGRGTDFTVLLPVAAPLEASDGDRATPHRDDAGERRAA